MATAGPMWLRAAIAVLMALVAGVFVSRALLARRAERPVDVWRACMAASMAWLVAWPPGTSGAERLALVFAVPAAWLVWRTVRAYLAAGRRAALHPAREAVCCSSMVWMLGAGVLGGGLVGGGLAAGRLTSDRMPGMSMPGGSSAGPWPVFTWALLALVALVGVMALLDAARAALPLGAQPRAAGAGAPLPVVGYHVALSVASAYMLAAML